MGLYLHIPFCIKKCSYCDFLSFGGIPEEEQAAYFRALNREIALNGLIYGKKYYVDTIFIGGGTPTLAEARLIMVMLDCIKDSFAISPDVEFSMESNPGTLTRHKLDAYHRGGINRLSIGAQSLDNRLLRGLGRIHTAEEFLDGYRLARDCGFENINIDLMFAIPGQTMEIWSKTLKEAKALDPEHISFYSLQIEEDTPFWFMARNGTIHEADEELDREMYHYAVDKLESWGFRHYEISNGAKDGFPCRHNLKYWSMEEYLGLGLGAHSFLEGTRFSNKTDLNEYISTGGLFDDRGYAAAGTGGLQMEGEESPFIAQRHRNTREDNISEYLFTGLRKIQGIELLDFKEKFGEELEAIHGEVLKKSLENGLMEITGGRLRFTNRGLDISNTVLKEFV